MSQNLSEADDKTSPNRRPMEGPASNGNVRKKRRVLNHELVPHPDWQNNPSASLCPKKKTSPSTSTNKRKLSESLTESKLSHPSKTLRTKRKRIAITGVANSKTFILQYGNSQHTFRALPILVVAHNKDEVAKLLEEKDKRVAISPDRKAKIEMWYAKYADTIKKLEEYRISGKKKYIPKTASTSALALALRKNRGRTRSGKIPEKQEESSDVPALQKTENKDTAKSKKNPPTEVLPIDLKKEEERKKEIVLQRKQDEERKAEERLKHLAAEKKRREERKEKEDRLKQNQARLLKDKPVKAIEDLIKETQEARLEGLEELRIEKAKRDLMEEEERVRIEQQKRFEEEREKEMKRLEEEREQQEFEEQREKSLEELKAKKEKERLKREEEVQEIKRKKEESKRQQQELLQDEKETNGDKINGDLCPQTPVVGVMNGILSEDDDDADILDLDAGDIADLFPDDDI